jgi:hypothetical protein
VANIRFTVSTDPEVHSAIKAHADAAGLDVSAYVVAAAAAQMATDDAAAAVFAPLDADNAAAAEQATAMTIPALPALEDLSAEEQALVRRVLSSALGSDHAGAA